MQQECPAWQNELIPSDQRQNLGAEVQMDCQGSVADPQEPSLAAPSAPSLRRSSGPGPMPRRMSQGMRLSMDHHTVRVTDGTKLGSFTSTELF